MNLPSICIVTPSFNQGHFLEETILSILNQDYPSLQFVVIDGGSNDNTIDVIKKYENHIDHWVSEKDRGQVHALNKGLRRATADIFGFINSDDLLLPGALAAVGRHFAEHPQSDWVCGDTIMFGKGHPTTYVKAVVPQSLGHLLSWSYNAPQPGMFWRRQLVEREFQECWPYDFDHDMYVRLMLDGHRCEYLPIPFAAYRLHEASKTVAENHMQNDEFERISVYYEPRLGWRDRRWSKATRFLRKSYRLSDEHDRRGAAYWLMRALATYPEGAMQRPFWGVLRHFLDPAGKKQV